MTKISKAKPTWRRGVTLTREQLATIKRKAAGGTVVLTETTQFFNTANFGEDPRSSKWREPSMLDVEAGTEVTCNVYITSITLSYEWGHESWQSDLQIKNWLDLSRS